MITEQEILSQPTVWRGFAAELAERSAELRNWVARRAPREIWLCGAGSSAFIGDILTPMLNALSGTRHRPIPTTSLVGRPQDYLGGDTSPLVISFGRSGNSPETIGTLALLDRRLPHADRLDITCNAESALARHSVPGPGEQRRLLLPETAHDQGFAMTASFSTMLLSALACLDPAPPFPIDAALATLAAHAEPILTRGQALLRGRLVTPPERLVFLGAGPLEGLAREAALKTLELSAGAIATSWDSPLGFRHGPKAFVDAGTLVVVFLSADPHTRRYDRDIADEIRRQYGANSIFTIGPAEGRADLPIPAFGCDAWNAVLYLLLPQLMATHYGKMLGLDVDNPFARGTLSRVVSGVTLYPYAE